MERYLPLPPEASSSWDVRLRWMGAILMMLAGYLAGAVLLGGAAIYGPRPDDVFATLIAFLLLAGCPLFLLACAVRNQYYYVPDEPQPAPYRYFNLVGADLAVWALPGRFYARRRILAITPRMALRTEGWRPGDPSRDDVLELRIHFRDRELQPNHASELNRFYGRLLEYKGDIRMMSVFLRDARASEGALPFTFGGEFPGHPAWDF